MRAEVSASLCSPEERPVSLKIDPVKLDTRLSGTPSVSADPVEVELPEITVTVPEMTVELPNPTLTMSLGSRGQRGRRISRGHAGIHQ